MSYGVKYVLNVSGETFHSRLDKGAQATAEQKQRFIQAELDWEAKLPGSDMSVAFPLDGQVTVVSIPVRYSLFLWDEDKLTEAERKSVQQQLAEVYAFEDKLKALFPGAGIYRISEMYYDEWDLLAGEGVWFKEDRYGEFAEWVEQQDPLYWHKIQ